jgi:hypothetical protein
MHRLAEVGFCPQRTVDQPMFNIFSTVVEGYCSAHVLGMARQRSIDGGPNDPRLLPTQPFYVNVSSLTFNDQLQSRKLPRTQYEIGFPMAGLSSVGNDLWPLADGPSRRDWDEFAAARPAMAPSLAVSAWQEPNQVLSLCVDPLIDRLVAGWPATNPLPTAGYPLWRPAALKLASRVGS